MKTNEASIFFKFSKCKKQKHTTFDMNSMQRRQVQIYELLDVGHILYVGNINNDLQQVKDVQMLMH